MAVYPSDDHFSRKLGKEAAKREMAMRKQQLRGRDLRNASRAMSGRASNVQSPWQYGRKPNSVKPPEAPEAPEAETPETQPEE